MVGGERARESRFIHRTIGIGRCKKTCVFHLRAVGTESDQAA